MAESVAIVGKAATAALGPYDDKEWDVWGLAWVNYPRASLLFDIHHPSFKADPPYDTHHNSHKNAKYFADVNASGIPVMCDPEAIGSGERQFHNGIEYPLDEVQAALPRLYLDCTVAYMVAYAILKKYKRIGMWGCHFKFREEFGIQLPSVTWLLGLAEGKGIKVDICPGSPLLVSGYVEARYGVSHDTRWGGR